MLFGITFVILAFVELTLAHTKVDALQFVLAILIGGLALRAYTLKRQGLTTLTVTREVAQMVTPDLMTSMRPHLEEGQKIMVAARGITPVLSFALDEAQLRKATLFVLYVKEVAVYYTAAGTRLGRSNWEDDPEANAIMCSMRKLGNRARHQRRSALRRQSGRRDYDCRSCRHDGHGFPRHWCFATSGDGEAPPR